VLLAVGEYVLGEFPDVCRRMGTGFSGGLGGTHQELCGALSGAVLVSSMLLGRTALEENDRPAMNAATLYRARFLARFGHTQCARLRERIKAPGGLGSCAELVERATVLLLELLAEMA
jgi:C_GCAxxG_C_C family probable redox protein